MADLGEIADIIDGPAYSQGGVISGTTADKDGNAASRQVTLLSRQTDAGTGLQVIAFRTSAADGSYSFPAAIGTGYVVIATGEPDRNALIFDNVIPD